MREIITRAIRETIPMFFCNPAQFHGDTGIMHFLYHRMMKHGEDKVFRTSKYGKKTLLLQSEHYTSLPYLQKGITPTSARMDYAFLNPDSIPEDGNISRKRIPAMIGFEVGRNKNLEKMGNMLADHDCPNPKPGDAAKLIRELRFASMKSAYLLEFYDNAEYLDDAHTVLREVKSVCESLNLQGLNVIVAMKGENNVHGWVSAYPEDFRMQLQLEYAPLPENAPTIGSKTVPHGKFMDYCGPCNKALLRQLKTEFPAECRWGRISMTIRRSGCLWMRITNQEHPEGETIQEIHPTLAEVFQKEGIDILDDDYVIFPESVDESFSKHVLDALQKVLEGPTPKPPVQMSNYEHYCCHCSPSNLLLQNKLNEMFPIAIAQASCLWGHLSMSVRQKYRKPDELVMRICNKEHQNGEMIREIDSQLVQAFVVRGISVNNGQVRFPTGEEPQFVEKVIDALKSIL